MSTIDTMTPRQLTAGLMRGNRLDFRRGYSALNAAGVAIERHSLSTAEAALLNAYAAGFADGMQEGIASGDPAVKPMLMGPPALAHLYGEYQEGRRDGLAERPMNLYPTPDRSAC